MHCAALRTIAGTASRRGTPFGAAERSCGADTLCVSSGPDACSDADCRCASACSAASAARWSRSSMRFWKLHRAV